MAVSDPVHGLCKPTHNFSSGKRGGMGALSVRAQYKASKP